MNQKLMVATAMVASALLPRIRIAADDVPALLRRIAEGLIDAGALAPAFSDRAEAPQPQAVRGRTLVPAVPISQSILPDAIICLEDGRRMKTLRRHLRARYGMTPEEYRAKWGLPADYPMVAPSYARLRSSIGKKSLLARRRAARSDQDAEEGAPASDRNRSASSAAMHPVPAAVTA